MHSSRNTVWSDAVNEQAIQHSNSTSEYDSESVANSGFSGKQTYLPPEEFSEAQTSRIWKLRKLHVNLQMVKQHTA